MSVIKVFRSAAFADLAKAMNRFGAMLQFEAEAVFGKELIARRSGNASAPAAKQRSARSCSCCLRAAGWPAWPGHSRPQTTV